MRNFKWKQYTKSSGSLEYDTPSSSEDTIDINEFKDGSTIHQVVRCQGDEETKIGIIAQELESVLPNSIATDETTNAKNLKATDEILWHMVNAIKELSAKVTALEAA